MPYTQATLFPDAADGARRALPVIGTQRDITYHAASARRILNGPETTGLGFWSINPYVGCAFGCAYCYARYAHRYAMERASSAGVADGLPPWLAFERRIVVKENAAAALRRDLRQPRAAPLLAGAETVVIGTATDPYQPAERRWCLTRGVLETLAEHARLRVSIITKSPLVTRDVEVLSRLARRGRVAVHVSLITLDRELARRIEPRAPTPEARLRAVERLCAAGLDVRVNCMPVLPGITDGAADLDALVRRVAAAGASHFGACALRLQRTARERYLPWVAGEFPALAARYRAVYAASADAPAEYRRRLAALVRRLCDRHGISTHSYDDAE
jgi:DNA repair photolyase